jgi:hypothetical protein
LLSTLTRDNIGDVLDYPINLLCTYSSNDPIVVIYENSKLNEQIIASLINETTEYCLRSPNCKGGCGVLATKKSIKPSVKECCYGECLWLALFEK